ncbi:MAG: ATP-binding protein [Roseateles sp.]|uniref:ATP-binding protein n=1 Tax=Roseateles sp. TaxID=1971397 RepID=UPI004036F28C
MSTSSHPDAVDQLLPLAVQLLGGFSVGVGGAAPLAAERWTSLRATHLVQLLSLQPRHRMARERVIDTLWPDLAPDAGAANLRKAVHHVRQVLGRHDAIIVRGGEVALWPERPVLVDADAFCGQADLALVRRDAAECAEAARQYGGALLPGASYEPWTEAARERLQSRYLDLLRASAQWEKLARLEPDDEPAHRALMQRELEAGNRAAALRWYAHLREALKQSLGVAPDAQTEAIYARCLAGLLASGPAFVGRAAELGQALAWLGMAADERPGGIVLSGPGGIGKSALGREIAAQAAELGWVVTPIKAAAAGRPYAVVTAIVERLLLADRALLDRIGSAARNVLALLSPVAGPAQPLPGPLGRHQVVGALRRLVVAAAGGSNVLLQIDDAHGAEDADVDVTLQLISAAAPVCVLVTTRAPAAGSALARGLLRLQSAGALRRLDIGPLDDDECRRLVMRATARRIDDALVDRVVAAAGGNPFAAIELARSAAATGDGKLPASVADAVLDRLCDVPADALGLLRWLALSGDGFDIATVEALAQAAQALPLAALDACLQAGVLVPAGSRYRFRHDLVRQALVEQMPPHRRVRLHREIADLLAQQDAAPADVARHWLEGGKPREAAPFLLAAARDAMRLAAFSDALRHLELLLAGQPGHAEGLRLRAEALDAMGDPAALPAYRLAASAAEGNGVDDLMAKAALAQVKQGDPKGALVLLQGLKPASVDGRLSEALAYSGAAALGATDPAMGTIKSAQARRLALQSADTSAIVVASWAQAAAAHARGELHQSVWADLQETSQVPHLAVRVFDGHLCITQRFLYGARPYADVIAFADALAAEARRLGAARGQAFATTLRGEAEWLAGDLVGARLRLRDGARMHRAIGGAVGEALSLQRLSEVSLHEGRREEARALLDEALDVARQTDIGFHLLDRIYGTRITLHADDPQAALHVMRDAAESVRGPLETCPGCRITFAVPAAIAAARAGEVALAEQHEAQCAYLANVVMRLPAWYAAHDEVRGHLSRAQGAAADESRAHFAAAAVRFRGAGHPIDAARCEQLAERTA